ncbi:MAG: hypothetical protein IJ092_04760 [Atopobiaceae bacterium]|nr:hypothetical protein [Atopobiaceae bacterium]MBR1828660.1 hypothetical protein [Atopobiaceae bacterium]
MMDSDKKDEDWLYDDDADLAIDQEIYDRLHAALDAAGPSEEAQDRMLASLLAAQELRNASLQDVEPNGEVNGSVEYVPFTGKIANRNFTVLQGRKRRAARRTLGLAIAASFLIAVLGVSVGSHILGDANQSADYAQETAAPAEAEAMGSAKNEMAETDLVSLSSEADSAEPVSEESAPDEALDSSSELDAFAPSGGAFDVSADPSYDLAVGYPEIRLRSGEVLKIEEHLGDPVIIGDEWVEGFKGDADAFSEDGLDSVRCWVYLLPVSDDGLYVVRYVQDGSCYAARIVE